MELVEGVVKGNELCAAKLISLIEEGEQEGYLALRRLLPYTGNAHVIGVTGPAGAGKSTVIGKLAAQFCRDGKKVAVIAVDPTSIRSSGAFLGDRLRMKEAEKAGDVFIRSMAQRNHPGGICRAASGAVCVMEGLGKDVVIIESVGAGQSDKALFHLADTVITLFTPEFGDEVQLLKAGLFEIGDVVVINKGDMPGVEDARQMISAYIGDGHGDGWHIPILSTIASRGEGIDELMRALETRWEFLREADRGRLARREKRVSFLMTLLKEELWKFFAGRLSTDDGFQATMEEVREGRLDPYSAVDRIMDGVKKAG